MISNDPRCCYRSNQLGEVICQLRFPEILTISAKVPVDFQEAIRDEFPRYSVRQETPPPRISGVPGNLKVENQPQVTNYQFVSADGVWRVNLTGTFLSLSCNHYTSWEDFARKLDKPLVALIKTYKPAFFERVGLRYVNFFSRQALELNCPFSELIAPCYLGPMAEEDVNETSMTQCNVNVEMALRGGCKLKIHASPGLVKRNNKLDNELKYIFDQDLYMEGNVPVNMSAGALQTLHSQAWGIFRGAITDKLHQAMDPQPI